MPDRTFILADGENLVLRYEASLQDGAKKTDRTFYDPGTVVWHKEITRAFPMDVIRVSYYTTQVGDEKALERTRKKIASYSYEFKTSQNAYGRGRLCPQVFKKERNSKKTKSVDINLTIDALRHTYKCGIAEI